MPLIKSKSKPAFKQNVRTLMGEVGKSPHVQSRAQALAIAYSTARRAKKAEGGKIIKGGAIDRLPEDRLSSNIEDRRGERQGSWREERRQALQDQADAADMRNALIFGAKSGRTFSRLAHAGGGGVKIAAQTTTAPWYQRSALRNMTRGAGGVFRMPGVAALRKQYALGGMPAEDRLAGSGPGRTDNKPINVKSGSYIIPADIVSGLGQGNTLAGKEKIGKMFSGAKVNRYGGGKFRMPGVPGMRRGQFAEGGSPKTVPIIAADGEHELQPHEVEWFGNGDMKRGHDALDAWVLAQRKKNIKDLRRLKPPRKN